MTSKRPNTAELLQSNYTTVSVVFDDVAVDELLDGTVTPAQGQRYTYKADLSLELQVGGFCGGSCQSPPCHRSSSQSR